MFRGITEKQLFRGNTEKQKNYRKNNSKRELRG